LMPPPRIVPEEQMRNKYLSLSLHVSITILARLFRGTTPKRIRPETRQVEEN
jgi:hypothetical protein